ncbi:MAG: hypothetical protein RI984_497 [Pseudomonadota bacterium]
MAKKDNNNTQEKLLEAITLQNSGDFKKATALFLQILKNHPDNVFALYSLTAIESNAGNTTAALNYVNRALKFGPHFAPAHMARSVIYFRMGQVKEALEDIENAIRLQPDLAGAEVHRQAIINIGSQAPAASHSLAGPGAALNLKALELQQRGQLDEAAALFHQVLAMQPQDFVAQYSLGVISSNQGNPEQALNWLTGAVAADPSNAQAQYALATTLQGMALYEQALDAFDRSLTLNPKYMEAYNNKATLLHSMNRHLDALKTLEVALTADPTDQKSLNNKGYLLTEFKQNAIAATVFKHLLTLNPDYEYAEGLHALARLHSCDWTDFDANKQRIVEGVRAGKRVANPFALMAISDSAADHLKCAEIFGKHRFAPAKQEMWKGETYRHRKKRVAFISADFREHPVGYLLIGLIENFDKSKYETYGISLGIRDGSELFKRYRCAFDQYLDVQDKSSLEIARIMRSMEIDIAIDLSGYTSGSRLDILSHRPAPVQATYLGFPGGLNVPYIDYLISDKVTVPEIDAQHYHEKLLYLPHCYLPRDTSVKPAPTTLPRSEFGLPDKGLVFCSFNHDYKINPPIFSAWMDLMRENPDSVLWLMKLNDDAQQNLAKNANFYGVDPARLKFATRVPRIEDHLARYRHADVFLDTFPYNGHTTASDALLAGVPVVTLTGNSFASRVATSLLHDMGRADWCTTNIEEYKNQARAHIARAGEKTVAEKEATTIDWPITEKMQADGFCQALDQVRGTAQ